MPAHTDIPTDAPADEAIPRLIDAHGGTLYQLGLRLCGDPEDAEDIVQETFLNAWRGWDRFEGRAEPTTWLYTIAARVCQRKHRKRAGEPARIESIEGLLPGHEAGATGLTAPAESPIEALMRRDASAIVGRAISRLPETFQIPLVLKDIADFSLAEVAEILDIKTATAKTRVHRGRLYLRRELERELAGDAAAPPDPRDYGICLALLEAKQEALDRDAPFPLPEDVIDERCGDLVRSLDLTRDACRALADSELPDGVRDALVEACQRQR